MPTPVRIPDDLKGLLKAEAVANDRSLNGEILARLRQSFKGRRTQQPTVTAKEHP
ncbi:MAG: Arc family DNA-binding protein [Pseudorhodoferax sp.]